MPRRTLQRLLCLTMFISSWGCSSPTIADKPVIALESEIPARKPPRIPQPADGSYNPEDAVVGTVVAVVNGDIVTKEEVLRDVRQVLEGVDADRSLTDIGRHMKKKQLIHQGVIFKVERLLALQEAKLVLSEEERASIRMNVDGLVKNIVRQVGTESELKQKLATTGKITEEQRQAELDAALIRALLRREVDAHVSLTPAEMRRYYAGNIDSYRVKSRVRIRHIFLANGDYSSRKEVLTMGRSLRKRIVNGEDFGTVAKQYSTGPYAKEGGLWDYVVKGSGSFRKEIEAVAFQIPVKSVGTAVLTDIGVHVVKVEDRQRARTKPFTEVQDEIAKKLRGNKWQVLYRAFVSRLREKSYIRIRWR